MYDSNDINLKCDVEEYNNIVDKCREIFIKRYSKYGSDNNKDKAYIDMCVGVKCYRIFYNLKSGLPITNEDKDTVMDLINFLVMELKRLDKDVE